ncbi:MAG: hypothetical protein KBC84_00180 [Proteobacteria bacterium]|nr:hypothetical protein [Pseudomonadota bacterium]
MYYAIFILSSILGVVINYFLFIKKSDVIKISLDDHLGEIARLKEEKKSYLVDLANIALGNASKKEIDQLQLQISELEQEVASKKGQIALTEAELESLNTRIKELEEAKMEAEWNHGTAQQEITQLEEDQKSIQTEIESLKKQLQEAIDKLDTLFELLVGVSGSEEALNKAKAELQNAENQLSEYTIEFAKLSKKYIVLKQDYDALDVEYAELYEQQGLE